MNKKHIITITGALFLLFVCITAMKKAVITDDHQLTFIPPSDQRTGDATKGYDYLTTGDYLKSGVPYNYFIFLTGKDKHNYLKRQGKNATVAEGYNVVTTAKSVAIVVPTCLQCHAQVFGNKLYIGLGNTTIDFSSINKQNSFIKNAAVKLMHTFSPKQYEAAQPLMQSLDAIYQQMGTEVRGINAADRLASLLVAHRDPQTLEWNKKPLLDIPDEVIPTDVPAWWLLKKKNAMFYIGFGRGDFGKFLMLSNILTVKDSAEAREVNSHFGDVLAYIRSIEPPKYPLPINEGLALEGKTIFTNTCSKCHGTYGTDGKYPNFLVPESIIKTDSMLLRSNQQNKQFLDWFNKSWFAQGENPARLEPSNGYVAPPLDGVWITAPYLHNGSVPTLEAVLNSKIRPTYWSRNFKDTSYDYKNIGWKYAIHSQPNGKKYYNTTLPGYGNYGHYFGDKLTDTERKAVIEYLKTL